MCLCCYVSLCISVEQMFIRRVNLHCFILLFLINVYVIIYALQCILRKKVSNAQAVHIANLCSHHTHTHTQNDALKCVHVCVCVLYVCVYVCRSMCDFVWEGPLCQEH